MNQQNKIKLWLDDIRTPLIGYVWAKNFDEAVAIMKAGNVDIASLDHDLSFEHYQNQIGVNYKEKTGYDFVCWMEEHDCWPETACYVHSWNPYGSARMAEVIAKHYGVRPNQVQWIASGTDKA